MQSRCPSSIPILTAGIGSCTIRGFPYGLKNYLNTPSPTSIQETLASVLKVPPALRFYCSFNDGS